MTPVGFEPTPFRNGALSDRLKPLGQSVLGVFCKALHTPELGRPQGATSRDGKGDRRSARLFLCALRLRNAFRFDGPRAFRVTSTFSLRWLSLRWRALVFAGKRFEANNLGAQHF
jgi:hypothetical protein